jgi:hypothetical protein
VDAWCHKREQLLSFSVDAISSCEMLEEPAKEMDPKEVQKQMQAGYGIFSGQDVSWAKLKFSAQRARWVQNEEWHPEQKVTVHQDGTYILEIPYSDERELLADILKFGAEAEIIEPPSLRESIFQIIKKTYDLYNKN